MKIKGDRKEASLNYDEKVGAWFGVSQTISRDEMLSGLQQQLPGVIDQLTPDGRLPTEEEASRWV